AEGYGDPGGRPAHPGGLGPLAPAEARGGPFGEGRVGEGERRDGAGRMSLPISRKIPWAERYSSALPVWKGARTRRSAPFGQSPHRHLAMFTSGDGRPLLREAAASAQTPCFRFRRQSKAGLWVPALGISMRFLSCCESRLGGGDLYAC